MPKPNFKELCDASSKAGEYRDCSVKAVALCCGVDYATAHATLKAKGRKNRRGTPRMVTWAAVDALGYEAQRLNITAAKTMTTLPAAMKELGFDKGRYMVFVSGHVAAFVDGALEDWTKGRRHRITHIYRIVPKGTPTLSVLDIAKGAMKNKKPTFPGVTAKVTRPYLAGCIIARHGLEAGVTQAMVKELDELYGKPNAAESLFCLKNAWHAARGYAEAQKRIQASN